MGVMYAYLEQTNKNKEQLLDNIEFNTKVDEFGDNNVEVLQILQDSICKIEFPSDL